MSQKFPVYAFKWKKYMLKFNEEFIKSYDEHSDKGYILDVDFKYPKRFHNLHCYLSLLPEK